jgi:hypothetical protein
MASADEKKIAGEAMGQPASPVDSIQYGDTEQANYPEKGSITEDVDDALKFLGTGERITFTEEQNKKLLWKIGRLMPTVPSR